MTSDMGGARLGKAQHDGWRTAYQGPRVPPNLLRKSVPPASASRRLRWRSGGPDSRSATRLLGRILDGRMIEEEIVMTCFQPISAASDRVLEALIAGLEIEFGRGAGEALAHRFLEAEEADFRWDARVDERWVGAYQTIGDDDLELDRVAIVGRQMVRRVDDRRRRRQRARDARMPHIRERTGSAGGVRGSLLIASSRPGCGAGLESRSGFLFEPSGGGSG